MNMPNIEQRIPPMEQLSGSFELRYKGNIYRVMFIYSEKKWYVYKGGQVYPVKAYPWNGVRLMVDMQDAEDILREYFGIDE